MVPRLRGLASAAGPRLYRRSRRPRRITRGYRYFEQEEAEESAQKGEGREEGEQHHPLADPRADVTWLFHLSLEPLRSLVHPGRSKSTILRSQTQAATSSTNLPLPSMAPRDPRPRRQRSARPRRLCEKPRATSKATRGSGGWLSVTTARDVRLGLPPSRVGSTKRRRSARRARVYTGRPAH